MHGRVPREIATLLHRAERERLYAPPAQPVLEQSVLDRAAVMEALPHRDPFLLLDEVCAIDRVGSFLLARYDLARAAAVFAGHFPGHAVYPGVLQVEAIGQAGILLHQHLREDDAGPLEAIALTHILSARFLRPVLPGGILEIVAHAFDDGLFFGVVGQCLRDGQICSVAAVSGLV